MCLISSNTAFLQCIVPAEWLIATRIINHIAYNSAKTAGNLNQKVWYLHPSTWSVTSLQAYEFLVIGLRHLQIHHSDKFAYFFRWRKTITEDSYARSASTCGCCSPHTTNMWVLDNWPASLKHCPPYWKVVLRQLKSTLAMDLHFTRRLPSTLMLVVSF